MEAKGTWKKHNIKLSGGAQRIQQEACKFNCNVTRVRRYFPIITRYFLIIIIDDL